MKRYLFVLLILAGCNDEQNVGYTPGDSGTGALQQSTRWAVVLDEYDFEQSGLSIAIDSIGDVVAADVQQDGASALYKLVASDGSRRWKVPLVQQTPQSAAEPWSIAIDSNDNIVVGGWFIDSIDFGGHVLTEASQYGTGFVAKYSAQGALISAVALGSTDSIRVRQLAVDASDNLYVIGSLAGTLQLGSASYTSAPGDQDTGELPATSASSFIASYTSSGDVRWSAPLYGAAASGLSIAANGDLIVAGELTRAASVGGAVLDPGGAQRGFWTRFRNDGLYLASNMIGDSTASLVWSVASAPDGTTALETIDGPIASPAMTLRQLDATGTEMWETVLGSSIEPYWTLATTSSSAVIAAQWVGQPTAPGEVDVVQASTTGQSDGAFGSRVVASNFSTQLAQSAVGRDGASAYVGTATGGVDFGTGELQAENGNGCVIVVDP